MRAANDNSKACEHCGEPFSGGAHNRRFCSDQCPRKAHRKVYDRSATLPTCTCQNCGTEYRPKRPERTTFCSRECSIARTVRDAQNKTDADAMRVRVRVKRKSCAYCDFRFSTASGRAFCSDACATASQSRRKVLAQLSDGSIYRGPRVCPECSVTFVPPYGRAHARYCSNYCSQRNTRRTARARRRARMRGAANDNINPFDVFARDGWKCRLCGVRTPRSLRGTHDDRAPELDHIIPLAKGGGHTLENVQCSCRKCNGEKGDIPLGQMLLFG